MYYRRMFYVLMCVWLFLLGCCLIAPRLFNWRPIAAAEQIVRGER